MLYARWQQLASSQSSTPIASMLRRIGKLSRRLWGRVRPISAAPPAAPVVAPAALRMQRSAMPWRMNALLGAAGLAIALAAGGCGLTSGYVAADRATYDAIAPEYAAYVTADPTLSPPQRQRRQNTLESWKLRLDAAQAQPTTLPSNTN